MIETQVHIGDANTPILALAIHNGHALPEALVENCGITEADRLREEDPYTGDFTLPYPNRIVVYTSRFAVDLNRSPHAAVYQQPEDCWGLPVRKQPLSQETLTALYSDYHAWYDLLAYQVRQLLSKHKRLLIMDLHSYNHHRLGPEAAYDEQEHNPDIIIGTNNMPASYREHMTQLCNAINGKEVRGRKIDCRMDVKFTGGYLSRWLHHTFPEQVICPAIEFKKIWMDEWTGVRDNEMQQALSLLLHTAVKSTGLPYNIVS